MSSSQIQQDLDEQGYAVVSNFLSQEEVILLRKECDHIVQFFQSSVGQYNDPGYNWITQQMGCIFELIQNPGGVQSAEQYYSLRAQTTDSTNTNSVKILCQSKFVKLSQQIFGSKKVYLFNEQYVVKPPNSCNACFPIHRDSQWCNESEQADRFYLSFWIPLDDTGILNGSLQIFEGSHKYNCLVHNYDNVNSDNDINYNQNVIIDGDDDEMRRWCCNTCFNQNQHVVNSSSCQKSDENEDNNNNNNNNDGDAVYIQQGSYNISSFQDISNNGVKLGSILGGGPNLLNKDIDNNQMREGNLDSALNYVTKYRTVQFGKQKFQQAKVMEVAAGSLVVLRSDVFHQSGENFSGQFRRVYMPQISGQPIVVKQTNQPVCLAVEMNQLQEFCQSLDSSQI